MCKCRPPYPTKLSPQCKTPDGRTFVSQKDVPINKINSSNIKEPNGGEAVVDYKSFDLKKGETTKFKLSKHEISITYVENSPKHKLEVAVDGEKEITEIERVECKKLTCKTCFETVVCKTEPSFCLWVDNTCQDVSEVKKGINYTCKEMEEKTDCIYYWERNEISFSVNPLIIEQDLDKDGKIGEDPIEVEGKPIDNDGDGLINEDYQEKYYFRNDWNTDLLEFEVWIKPFVGEFPEGVAGS